MNGDNKNYNLALAYRKAVIEGTTTESKFPIPGNTFEEIQKFMEDHKEGAREHSIQLAKDSRADMQAPANADQAAQVLIAMARYLRSGVSMRLGGWEGVADAIETAMTNPGKYDPHNADRGRALLVALNLEANNRRPADVNCSAVANFMRWEMQAFNEMDITEGLNIDKNAKVSQNKAAQQAAKHFGISKSTAIRIYKKVRGNVAAYVAALDKKYPGIWRR